jgi:flagella basal body P-ring formation protein FlgA
MMNTINKCDARLGALAGVMLLLGNCAFGQVIRLSAKAEAVAGQDVRLGNIATITGADPRMAAALADTVVLPAVVGNKTLQAESVLMAVITQLGAENTASQLQLSGSASCEITVSSGTPNAVPAVALPVVAAPITAMAPMSSAPAVDPAEPVSSTVVTASVLGDAAAGDAAIVDGASVSRTFSQLITDRLQHELKMGPNDFQWDFDTHQELRDAPAPDGAHWQFRPLTRTFVGTVVWEVEAVHGTRITERMTVETKVLIKKMVLTATVNLDRGEPVTKDSYTVDEAWLDRDLPTLVTDEKDALGLAPQRNIAAGERLDKRDLKPMVLAQRGDTVTVVFLSGSLKVNMTGQAMGSGKMHDAIEVQNESTHERYQAVLIGKKLAVVGGTLTAAQEKQLRESL